MTYQECPRCCGKVSKGTDWCIHCGTSLRECPRCGKLLIEGDAFCSGCGYNIASAAQAQNAQYQPLQNYQQQNPTNPPQYQSAVPTYQQQYQPPVAQPSPQSAPELQYRQEYMKQSATLTAADIVNKVYAEHSAGYFFICKPFNIILSVIIAVLSVGVIGMLYLNQLDFVFTVAIALMLVSVVKRWLNFMRDIIPLSWIRSWAARNNVSIGAVVAYNLQSTGQTSKKDLIKKSEKLNLVASADAFYENSKHKTSRLLLLLFKALCDTFSILLTLMLLVSFLMPVVSGMYYDAFFSSYGFLFIATIVFDVSSGVLSGISTRNDGKLMKSWMIANSLWPF